VILSGFRKICAKTIWSRRSQHANRLPF